MLISYTYTVKIYRVLKNTKTILLFYRSLNGHEETMMFVCFREK